MTKTTIHKKFFQTISLEDDPEGVERFSHAWPHYAIPSSIRLQIHKQVSTLIIMIPSSSLTSIFCFFFKHNNFYIFMFFFLNNFLFFPCSSSSSVCFPSSSSTTFLFAPYSFSSISILFCNDPQNKLGLSRDSQGFNDYREVTL